MVAVPILGLPSVSSLTGNEQFPVVQYGATKKASINDIAVPLSHFFPAIGVAITGVNSVETGGSLVSGVTIDLVNDTASPGALMLYGTDLAGTRGWQPQTAGGTVAVVDSGAGLTGGPITVSGSLSVATNGIADTMLRQSAALSVMGRSANSTGNVADIAATTSGHVLQVVGNALAFAPVTASGIGAVASVSGTANEITAIGVDVVTIGLSNTLYFGGKTVSGGTFYNMVVNNITVSGGTEQGVTYSGGTFWNSTLNNPTISGGTFQGITVSGGTFNNLTISGSTFLGPNLSNAIAGGNWTTSGTWALPAITLSGAVTATGQTITNGTYNNPTVSGGNFSAPKLSTGVAGGVWTTSGTWTLPSITVSGNLVTTGTATVGSGSTDNIQFAGGTGSTQITAAGGSSNVTLNITSKGTGNIALLGNNNGFNIAVFQGGSSIANYFSFQTATAGSGPLVTVGGSDTDVNLRLYSKNSGNLDFGSTGGGQQFGVLHTASANRYVTATGSNGGNPVIGTTAGALALSSTQTIIASGTATPAGGAASTGMAFGTTANFGVFFGSGVPTVSAAQGSWYLRSDGSTTSSRAYVNTGGTWTPMLTFA